MRTLLVIIAALLWFVVFVETKAWDEASQLAAQDYHDGQ